MELCLTNGHVVDSVNRIDEILDVRIVDGKIAEVGRSLPMKIPSALTVRVSP